MKKSMAHVLEAQIKSLKEEISALQEQHDRNDPEKSVQVGGCNVMQDAGRCRKVDLQLAMTGQMKGGQGTQTAAILKSEIKEMEDDLIRQTKMNGIALTNCCVKTMEKSDTKIVQHHSLTGQCSMLAFQIEFELTDVKEEGTFVRSVTDLNIVMDDSEIKQLSTFVSRAEHDKNMLLFFRTLRTFSERLEDRRRTFQHFQAKYPNVVSLPWGCKSNMMLIQNPQLPGCALMIHWDIEVTTEGDITPKIELVTKMPENCEILPFHGLSTSVMFQSLLRVVGVEASIESIIKTV